MRLDRFTGSPLTATMAGGVDRISELPDDLLQRILHFAPAKDAAATGVLSTRWRLLWRSTGAVNLAARVTDGTSPHRAITIRARGLDVLGDVLSHPAARHVEELRLGLAGVDSVDIVWYDDDTRGRCVGSFCLGGLGAVRPENLRVLDLAGCNGLPAGAALPRLATLRLRLCSVQLDDLQGIIESAPELATVHLESVHLTEIEEASYPTEIDAPRLRSLKYGGYARRFSLMSPAPDMARVELDFLHENNTDMVRGHFWRFLHSFRDVKNLKLKVIHLKQIAVAGKATRADLLLPLPGVERVELSGLHGPASETAAVAIANLLRCCPNVRDLVLRLSTVQPKSTKNGRYGRDLLRRDQQADLAESLDRFARRRRRSPVINGFDDVGDIHGLSGRSFPCLQSSLRRVSIQFRLDEHNCLGVRLIKFFVENATCLEEMCIDGGKERMFDHINHRVERWIASLPANMASAKCEDAAGSSQEFCTADSVPSVQRECNALEYYILSGDERRWIGSG
ncbi:hypothetical protein E2562_033643 [Oryza meyeriana var. granulata]|uniref:F-box domain-containing protein n=1 Tax=Oryza meyeriana var. granulata TaxID=110450 RepID=A0A6G1CBT3_9ORYZ|nr:hypothetical protein E2562_033643 [Oryza meyeriana var. granulata]